MLSVFRFKDIECREYGVIITSPPVIPIAEYDEEQIAIPGRDGTVTRSNNRFKPVVISYDISWQNKYNRTEQRARAVKAWLCGDPRSGILSDTYDPNYFRKARYNGPADIENYLLRAGRVTVSFTCHPFKFSYLGQQSVSIGQSGDSLVNPEAFTARPYMRVSGASGSLYVNNETIIFRSIDGYTEIDSEARQVFKGSVNKSGTVQMGADFPVLKPGENVIQWDGGITQVEIIPRWCTL